MVNRSSALDANYKIGSFEINKKITLSFKEIRDLEIKQVAAWPSKIDKIDFKLANIINQTKAPGFNKSASNDNKHILRIEPLKWWIIGESNIEILDDEGSVLDLSHAFTSLEIKGKNVRQFLNRHLPLDLREQSFENNSISSSSIHHVSTKVWKKNHDEYILFIPRGFALSIWEILLETASQFGYEIL